VREQSKKQWVCIEVTAPREAAELLSCLLFEGGCRGIQEYVDKGAWRVLAFFEGEKPLDDLTASLADAGERLVRAMALQGDVRVRSDVVQPADWEKKWREGLSPFRVGRRTVVVPSRCTYERKKGEIVVTMDARMAFGSGHHETTKLAVRALERVIRPGASVLDAGAGSGILAIVAAKLGASRIAAVEVEGPSYENLIENVRANGLEGRIECLHAALAGAPRERVDVVAANLDKSGLLSGMAEIAERLVPEGTAILTGFLTGDSPEIEQRLRECDLTPRPAEVMGEWCLFLGVQK
jgi:ribosomal protein L11 methyltransferase